MNESQVWDDIKALAISKNFTQAEWERKRAALYLALATALSKKEGNAA